MFHGGAIPLQQDSQPVGAVMLIKYDVEQTPELRLNSFAVKKQGAPTLRLAADTEEAGARWTTVIKEAIERNDQVNIAGQRRKFILSQRPLSREAIRSRNTEAAINFEAIPGAAIRVLQLLGM